MKRILFLTTSLGFGGAEKMLTYVANQLCLRGHSVGIINLNSVPGYLNQHKQILNNQIEVFNVFNKTSGIKRYGDDLIDSLKYAKKFAPDVIIGFAERPNLLAKLISDIIKKPSIMSERGDPNRTNGRRGISNKIVAYVIDQSDGGVFQTDGAQKFFGEKLQKKSIIIPNPIFIDSEFEYKAIESKKIVVSVGRLDNEQKRYDIMLKAFKEFYKKHSEYSLYIYGDGSDKDQIEKMIDELNLNECVALKGVSNNPVRDITGTGMFLITSDYEGISNSLLEAMAVGLPCVSTDHTPGGARLLIQDHENGLLAPIGDYMKIADCMCEFAENPLLADRCGKNAKNVQIRFEPKRIIDMWEDYIMKVCEN